MWNGLRSSFSINLRVRAKEYLVNKFLMALAALLFASFAALAQNAPVTTEMGAADAKKAAAQEWLAKEKFTGAAQAPNFPPYRLTAYPKEGKFSFGSSREFCMINGPFNAVYTVKDDGQLFISVTRTRSGCGVIEMEFDPVTRVGKMERIVDGVRTPLPDMKVHLD